MSYEKLVNAFPDIAKKTVYTGPIDEFFGYELGQLEYHCRCGRRDRRIEQGGGRSHRRHQKMSGLEKRINDRIA